MLCAICGAEVTLGLEPSWDKAGLRLIYLRFRGAEESLSTCVQLPEPGRATPDRDDIQVSTPTTRETGVLRHFRRAIRRPVGPWARTMLSLHNELTIAEGLGISHLVVQ